MSVKPAETLTPSPLLEEVLAKIEAKTAQVAIIGMGYVGLPLSVCVAKIGFPVFGIDIDMERVALLNQGISTISDVTEADLKPLVEAGQLQVFPHFDKLPEADVIIICVPTPLTKNRDPDISYIKAAATEIARHLRPGQLVTLESTTYPGTTADVLRPILEKTGLVVGKDFYLAHSPERVDPGNARYTTHNTNKVVGGVTETCGVVASAFYRKSIQTIISVSSASCAEMVKVFENTFRAVNIALVNELALLADKMGLNVWEVLDAAATKPFGMMTFYPGPGVGGHCIPIDPFYLTWKAREYNFHTRFIELAGEINSYMPQFVREKIIRALGQHGKPLYGAKILLLGMAYKRDVDDWRQSPGVDIFHLLQNDNARVIYNDPFVPEIEDQNGLRHQSVTLSPEAFLDVDCVVLVTDHSQYDLAWILAHSPVVVDTRNVFKAMPDPEGKVMRL